MSLRSITDALGGDLYDGGRRANVPAPGHSRADRSVSLLLSGGRIVVHSFGGADWREVLDDLRARGLVDAGGAPLGRAPALRRPDKPTAARERVAAAKSLWDSAGPIGPGSASALHAAWRRVSRVLPGPDALRHHPAAPVSVYRPDRRTRPALVVAVTDADGALSGLELTYLAPNGRRAVDMRLARKTVGVVPPGSAVRLDPAAESMLVGEGVFTTLSATERFGLPGWALLSAGNLRRWTAPDGVRRVLIAADRGLAGQVAARALADGLRLAGVTVLIRTPAPPDGDWNDVAVRLARAAGTPRRATEEGGRLGRGAPGSRG